MLTRRLFTLLSSAAAFMPNGLRAQATLAPEALHDNANLYLALYLDLIEKADSGDESARAFLNQYASFVGDEARATAMPTRKTDIDENLILSVRPAIETIVENARDNRIVILNEHHCMSRHRSFTAQVLRALKPLGFDIFAAETFVGRPQVGMNLSIENLTANMPFVPNYGFYTRDPVYAETVRESLDLGYRLAAYEQANHQNLLDDDARPVDKINAREEAQARNFIDNILTPNPDSKIVVLCGHSHILEEPQDELEWFAARLKHHTGIDPLTVEQSLNWPAHDPANDPSLTRAVLERFAPEQPVCVFEPSGRAFTSQAYTDKVDLAVYHPRTPEVNGRPGWLANDPKRRSASVQFMPDPEICLIQAVRAIETMGAVPSDQVLVPAGGIDTTLYLRPGSYVVRKETRNGWDVIGSLTVT